MKKHEYEAPKFAFQELQLVERVANECWGAKLVWYDTNGDKNYDTNEPVFTTEKGCGDIDKQIKKCFPGLYENKNHTNSKEDLPGISKIFS